MEGKELICDEEFLERYFQWDNEMFLTKEEWDIIAPRIAKEWENSPKLQAAFNKYHWLILMKINTKLMGFDQNILRKDYIENYVDSKGI